MVEIKTEAALSAMREAGRVVARVLDALRQSAQVGTSLLELDELAREVLAQAGATAPFLHYRPGFAGTPFPAVICTSVNDTVVHGIPDGYRLRDGDLLSIDCGAELNGWVGDAAISVVVGTPRPEDTALIECTQAALRAGIAAAVVGARIGDIAHAVGSIGRKAGYGILADFGGHGIGRRMHEDPHVPNEGKPGRGMRLRHGMTLALEPMFTSDGQDRYRVAADGWGLHTWNRGQGAHVEHTIAITDRGPVILTAL